MIHNFFISFDGDLVGRQLENYVIRGDLEGLEKFCEATNNFVERIAQIGIRNGCHVYLKGGDSLLIGIDGFETTISLYREILSEFSQTFSVGIGKTPMTAYLALKYAKTLGKGYVILADEQKGGITFDIL